MLCWAVLRRTVAADVVLDTEVGGFANGDAGHDGTTGELRDLFDQFTAGAERSFHQTFDVGQEGAGDRISAGDFEAGLGRLAGFSVERCFLVEDELDTQVLRVVGFGFGVNDFGFGDDDTVFAGFEGREGGINFVEVDGAEVEDIAHSVFVLFCFAFFALFSVAELPRN